MLGGGRKDFQTRWFFALDLPVISPRNSKWAKLLLHFSNFTLDTDRRELRGAEGIIHVEPQVFDLLLHLAQNTNRVISKDELIEHVWKGRIVSDAALNSRINSARKAIGESGENQTLIKTVPRHGFMFAAEVTTRTIDQSPSHTGVKASAAQSKLTLPEKPSIAVLPFANLSEDQNQEYFADGIVEEIITALSRFRQLFVIARNSSFTYKGRAVDVKQVGRELGVRYVLEGSVRKAENRVRIAGQLIDASTGIQLWADRFDGNLADIFDLQDRVSASVVGAIAPKLEQAEIDRAKRKPTESLDAYDYYLRGMTSGHRWTKDSNDEALRLFYKAIELDPNFAAAYGLAAFCFVRRKLNRWVIDRQQEILEATRLARLAVELGKDDAVALAWGGHALGFLAGDLDSAIVFIDRARLQNPNLAPAWFLGGWVRAFRGELETAIELFERAIRLSPLDPTLSAIQNGVAFVHLLAGRNNDASLWAEMALREQPNYFPANCTAVASYALAGRLEEAKRAMTRLCQIDPTLRISNLGQWYPLRRTEDLAKFADGLRKGGLPE